MHPTELSPMVREIYHISPGSAGQKTHAKVVATQLMRVCASVWVDQEVICNIKKNFKILR